MVSAEKELEVIPSSAMTVPTECTKDALTCMAS